MSYNDPGSEPEELAAHLEAVAQATSYLADALRLDEWKAVLTAAAALHDLGKAHETFQEPMRTAIGVASADGDRRLWAKSGTSGGRYGRRYFRHKLASALALAHLADDVAIPSPHLTRYLVAATTDACDCRSAPRP